MEKEKNEIVLKQKPIISHELVEIGKRVTKQIKDLNLDNIVATEDNRTHLKKERTSLNKDFIRFEEERKSIKNGILEPYKDFEELYKVEISEKYEDADNKLKKAIDSVEDGIKKEKETNVRRFFNEMCASEKIDFLKLEDVKLNINLTVTEKKLKEEAKAFVERISNDISIINSMEYPEEMLVEYKSCRDAGRAINIVRYRYKKIEEEKQRKKIQENNRRISKLTAMGFYFDEMTSSYVYDDDLFIVSSEIESLEITDFDKKIIEFDEAIKEKKSKIAEPELPINEQKKDEAKEPVKEPEQTTISAPLSEPKKEEKLKARFEVFGTMSELKKLKAFLIENKYEYKNL